MEQTALIVHTGPARVVDDSVDSSAAGCATVHQQRPLAQRPLCSTSVTSARNSVGMVDFDPRGPLHQIELAREAIAAAGSTHATIEGARATIHWESTARAWLIQPAEPWLRVENPKSRRQMVLVQVLCIEFVSRGLPTLTRAGGRIGSP